MKASSLIIVLLMAGVVQGISRSSCSSICPRYVSPKVCPLVCPDKYDPVCASDCLDRCPRTFPNECAMHLTNCQQNSKFRKLKKGHC